MATSTPRVDPQQIGQLSSPVFRIIGQVTAQPQPTQIIVASPTTGGEMISLTNVQTSSNVNYELQAWYELVCRANDFGDAGFLVLDSVKCVFPPGESISVAGVVALQQLSSKFTEIM
ncbi:Replication factor A protein 3 [Lachancea thermotolerans]|uniref:KLTH0F04400p n=1 Tax=Lachancea thermotolerans (strain ATCC 56472 / CBS 6340 / NRRL Y-8284) TaxID=559295 RepID=C5DKG1_LACTC|nr:KLTH0F04400p [Lachancea thermotolerans CBS 6340]CAR23962.1 KLTH0F04400p [Lachancea thermotolerans CBS 6340]